MPENVQNLLALFAEETQVVNVEPGQELFKKGDSGRDMYVILSGELEVADGNRIFATVGPGEIVGEMALVSSEPRSATVRAINAATVTPVDERRFLFLVQHAPFFAVSVMQTLSARLKLMNSWVTSPERK
jgi:CRP-like cAMP-binding protein